MRQRQVARRVVLDTPSVLSSGINIFVAEPLIPNVSAGVYTIRDDTRFLYVRMTGRRLTAEEIEKRKASGGKRTGLFDRLNSHAGGRRSGDQFRLYVCDRLVQPTLTAEQIQAVSRGELKLDYLVRRFIRSELSYRFVLVGDGAAADAFRAAHYRERPIWLRAALPAVGTRE